MDAPSGYIVDVCRYCGRLAVFPGCEHWQVHAGWTMVIQVRPSPADRRKVQEAMDEHAAR